MLNKKVFKHIFLCETFLCYTVFFLYIEKKRLKPISLFKVRKFLTFKFSSQVCLFFSKRKNKRRSLRRSRKPLSINRKNEVLKWKPENTSILVFEADTC